MLDSSMASPAEFNAPEEQWSKPFCWAVGGTAEPSIKKNFGTNTQGVTAGAAGAGAAVGGGASGVIEFAARYDLIVSFSRYE
jgi:hypothetical protein